MKKIGDTTIPTEKIDLCAVTGKTTKYLPKFDAHGNVLRDAEGHMDVRSAAWLCGGDYPAVDLHNGGWIGSKPQLAAFLGCDLKTE